MSDPGTAWRYVQVTSTAGSRDEAARLGRAAVEARLAACAQVLGPIASSYRWAGELAAAEEWLVVLKTTAGRVPEQTAQLRAGHSYQVPEVVVTPIVAGDPDYLAWLGEETRGPG